MTDTETNQIVHKAMDKGYYAPIINLVGEIIVPAPNYLEHGKAWGEMLNWAMKQEWWITLICDYMRREDKGMTDIVELFANPRSLAEHIVKYLEKESR